MEITYIYLHVLVQPIIHDQAMCHSNAVRLHGMAGDIGVVAHVGVVEVRRGFRAVAIEDRLVEGRKGGHGWETCWPETGAQVGRLYCAGVSMPSGNVENEAWSRG